MTRCGKCCKVDGQLIPILLTARGVRSESYAHYPCFLSWKSTADVLFDNTRTSLVQVKKKYVRARKPKNMPMDSHSINPTVWRISQSRYYMSEQNNGI